MMPPYFDAEECLGVGVTNLLPRGGREVERADRLDGLGDIERAAFAVERAVGCEQHFLRAVEIEAALDACLRPGERGVGVEIAEIIEHWPRQFLRHDRRIGAGGARADLGPAVADAAFEERHHRAM